ncbi:MAG: hypothetical protein BIFFINMI_01051 [Phycisphaerae bacterium]|nr:hypothetical protein [Phycisphaerae bacterium]
MVRGLPRCRMIAACVALLSPAAWAAPPAEVAILNDASSWRYHLMLCPPTVTVASFKAAGQTATADKVCPRLAMNRSSDPPPADWVKPDFSDAAWPRALDSEVNTALTGKAHSFRASLRGKFLVSDPSAVADLTLSVGYRGGIRVFLNGVEVGREHLAAGELADDAPADPYPNGAWVDAAGKAFGYRDPWPAARNRTLGPLKLPASALRKGVNVLAIELRRSPFHPVALGWNDSGHPPSEERWVPVALLSVKLTAGGAGIQPNTDRRPGLQVWTEDRNNQVTVADRGDLAEARYPVTVVGARNGSWCGQLGVGSDKPIKGLRVSVSDLKREGAEGTIAASQVTLLYGVGIQGQAIYDDRLSPSPPAEVPVNAQARAAVVAVVVRVHIPADAAAGDYSGAITVSAEGQPPVETPLRAHVSAWSVPDPKDHRTFASIYQSPETIAMQYKVQPWSDEHFKLLEKSWELLGRAGNKVAIVNAVEQTQFGNDRSTIFWIRKPDGTYDWDFSVFDRYLQMAVRLCGPLDHVGLQIVHVGNIFNSRNGWASNPMDQVVTVSLKDPATGELESLKAPLFATAESKAFWKPYLAAVQAHLNKLGMEHALCLGILMDTGPSAELVKMFDDIWPDGDKSRWMRGCHVSTSSPTPYPAARGAAGVVVLHEHCYGGGVVNYKLSEARGYPGAYYFRNSIGEERIPLTAWMTFGDFCLYLQDGHKGIGRICLDYWPVTRRGNLYNRYPYSDCMQRAPTIMRLAWPGPDGALPTQRLEALIEGLQECEAVIYVATALEKQAERLDAPLADRCRRVLADRRHYADLAFCELENRSYGWAVPHPNHLGWQQITRNLYDCAADVAARLK